MELKKSDTYPLWSFGYVTPPTYDKNKIMTSRGRTPQEAWTCVQEIGGAFLEPEKVQLLAVVFLDHVNDYSESHRYDWFNEPPLWLKQREGAYSQIW
jgi:hypothetical protein